MPETEAEPKRERGRKADVSVYQNYPNLCPGSVRGVLVEVSDLPNQRRADAPYSYKRTQPTSTMMKLATLAALAGSAAAFAPAQQGRASTAVQGFENELGVIAPTGFFDPLGFTQDIDQEKFDQYRTAELKRKCLCEIRRFLR